MVNKTYEGGKRLKLDSGADELDTGIGVSKTRFALDLGCIFLCMIVVLVCSCTG